MNNRNILGEISSRLNEFTKVEKKIAEYILNNSEKVPYMVINDLASACNVGETSIFRFCKKLKLEGYQEFRMKISSNLFGENVLRPTTAGDINIDDDLDTVSDKILESYKMALDETRNLIDSNKIEQAVTHMINANRIFLYGVGASSILAEDMLTKLIRITAKVIYVKDAHIQLMQSSTLRKDDVAICFSYSGNTRDSIDIVKSLKETGATIIGISKYLNTEFSRYVDLLILCGAKENILQGGSLSAKISQIYLIDILYTQYYKRTIEISKIYNERTAKAILKKLY